MLVTCRECGQHRRHEARGLCRRCWQKPAVRRRHPQRPNHHSVPVAELCRHCKRVLANRPRGLCWTCFYTPVIRAQYPSTSKFARPGADSLGLAPVAAYPDPSRLPRCEHGRHDGTCPECERRQRALLVIGPDTDADTPEDQED
jgi:hypothetical protein